MTRCSEFQVREELTLEEQQRGYELYVSKAEDPTLFFHVSGGADVIGVVRNYRPEDIENLGNAVLIRYNFGVSVVCKYLRSILKYSANVS